MSIKTPVQYDKDLHRLLNAEGDCIADLMYGRGNEWYLQNIGQQIADALNQHAHLVAENARLEAELQRRDVASRRCGNR